MNSLFHLGSTKMKKFEYLDLIIKILFKQKLTISVRISVSIKTLFFELTENALVEREQLIQNFIFLDSKIKQNNQLWFR